MAEYGSSGTQRENTFGRNLMTYIKSSMPYGQPYDLIDNVNNINPKFKDFYKTGTRRQDLISKHSVFTSNREENIAGVGGVASDKNYHAFMYANVDYDKSKRLRDYRVMAQFAEVADALDEICDECINKDQQEEFIKIDFSDLDVDINIKKELKSEFDMFISLYELEHRGWEYFRQMLVDGEVFFEHIIHKDHTEAGILGIINVPSEIVDPIYDNVQNLMIKGFLLRKPKIDKKDAGGNQLSNSNDDKVQHIPFDKNQVTYIHSGIWNETKTLRMPFVESARRAYRQLSLIEDSIIVYRLVRAPERLVFNVDVGNMAPPKAEAYLKRLMQNYWSRKTYDSNQGKSVQAFNPQSMLDAFWFAKRAGSDGTQVTTLEGGKNLGELEDLKYFQQKLYRALKVPVERLNPESQTDAQGATILREELKFARFIIRLQGYFARGLKDAFVTHLKLKGLWEEFELKEPMINIHFLPPSNFHELRVQQIHELKWNNYATAIGNQLISDTYAKKNFLKFTDEEILLNRELLRKDSALKWELAQIESGGPNWRDQFDTAGEEAAMGGGELGGMPPPAPMGGGMPPDFGPTPPGPEGGEPAPLPPAPAPGGETALPQ